MKALFLGRFQPFHFGHLNVVMEIAKKSEYIVIVIGSSQLSYLNENPFTAGERYTMIHESLKEKKIKNYNIVTLDDLNRYSLWVAHVISHSPKFEVVYARNPLTIKLFSEAGFKVMKQKLHNPKLYSGTEIRKRMLEGGEWRKLVPNPVSILIDELDGVNRLKDITGQADGEDG